MSGGVSESRVSYTLRYLDLEGLSPTNPSVQYARACDIEWDMVGIPLDTLHAGDTVVTGPWGDWAWLPEHIAIEVVPDGTQPNREPDPLVHALRIRGLPPALARKAPTPRARTYGLYMEAIAWVAAIASRVSRTSDITTEESDAQQYEIIRNAADALAVYTKLSQQPFAYDLETTGLDPHTSSVVGLALADADTAYWVTEEAFQATAPTFVALLEQPQTVVYGSNLKFDMSVLACQHGLVPTRCIHVWDTQVMDWVLDPGAFQHGLKYLAKKHLGRAPLEFADVIASYGSFRDVPVELAARYAAAGDARNSYDLVTCLHAQLVARDLLDVYTRLEQPVTPVLCEMQLAGLSLDRRTLLQIGSEFEDRAQSVRASLKELGFHGNPNADAQIARFLYGTLGLPALVTTAKQGRGSVALPVLRRLLLLQGSHEAVARWARVVELFIEWSDVDKNLSTFLVPWLVKHVNIVYTELKQTRVVTGRLSSEPNIQNWPARVRAMVVAPEEGWLCSADFAQGEPRLAAHYSQDSRMLDDFRSGRDVYQSLGVDMGFPLADLGKHSALRHNIKTVFLAWQYLTNPPKIQEIALRQGTYLPLAEARAISDGLKRARPEFVAWRQRLIDQARRDGGLVRDLFGRQRLVRGMSAVDPGMRDAAAREVCNFPAQAGLGGIVKGAMRPSQLLFRSAGGSLINQVHDELVGVLPSMTEKQREEFAHELADRMLWYELSVPQEVEIGFGHNWTDAKDGRDGSYVVRR